MPRVPLIPGISATGGNLEAIARFVRGRRCGPLQLIPYNPAVLVKLRALGKEPRHALPEGFMSAADEHSARAVITAVLHTGNPVDDRD